MQWQYFPSLLLILSCKVAIIDLSCLSLSAQHQTVVLKFNLFLLAMNHPHSSHLLFWVPFLTGWLLREITVWLDRGGVKKMFCCLLSPPLQRLDKDRAGTSRLGTWVPNWLSVGVHGTKGAMPRPSRANNALGSVGCMPRLTHRYFWWRGGAHFEECYGRKWGEALLMDSGRNPSGVARTCREMNRTDRFLYRK